MSEASKMRESVSDRLKGIASHVSSSRYGLVLVALAGIAAVFAAITRGQTFTPANMWNILIQSSIRGVVTIGQTFVILTSAIDVSIAGVGRVAALLGASMMTRDLNMNVVGQPVSMFIAIPIMLLTGAAFGLINGTLISRLGINSLVVTIGMWRITDGIQFAITKGASVFDLPESFGFLGNGYIGGVPVLVIVTVAIFVIGYFLLEHTPFGSSVYATGGNPVSAELSGINVTRTRLMVFVISGVLGGFTGVLYSSRFMTAAPKISMSMYEIDSIAAAVLGGVSLMGGTGSLIGAAIGLLMLGVINNGMSIYGLNPLLQSMVKGGVIIAAVAFDYMRRRQERQLT